MLLSLSIRNYILIDELDLELQSGLCVITGETGSGKSILLEAILLCLGGKVSGNIHKDKQQATSVTAIFSSSNELNNVLDEKGIETGDEISIKRVQHPDNRKKFLINEQVVTQKTVESLANYLFEIHGQNNHTTLLSAGSHMDILDNYGSFSALKVEVSFQYKLWQNILKEIEELDKQKDNLEREIDYLSFVVEELSKASVKVGDEEYLSAIRIKLQTRDKEIQLIQDLNDQLGSHELDNIISKSVRIINRSGKETTDFQGISKSLDDAYNHIEEARLALRALANSFNDSEYNLDSIEEKLFEIRDLARKYGVKADQLPEHLETASMQLASLQQKVVSGEKLISESKTAAEQYFLLAHELSAKRISAARDMEKKVQAELSMLKMEKAVFKVEIIALEIGASTGIDKIRFLAITNPGQTFAPIDSVASGGELSRFMLAFKTALFDKTQSTTVIFDEVDTGIGGAVAEAVGERLKKLSEVAQVLVITHQPQVASKARQHILIRKIQGQHHTQVSASSLNAADRAQELARMISGKKITESGVKAAEELLDSDS